MATKANAGISVKGPPGKFAGISHQGKPEVDAVECEKLCYRMGVYLDRAFARGMLYIMRKRLLRQFVSRTQYSRKHIERVFPIFQRWATRYKFERIRLGRSWQVKITPAALVRSDALRVREVVARLAGAAKVAAMNRGQIRVGLPFLQKFAAHSGLPPELIGRAWRSLSHIPGMRARWRGRGRGRCFFVRISDPQIPSLSSSLTGEEIKKQGARCAPDCGSSAPTAPDRGSLRSQRGSSAASPPMETLRDTSSRPTTAIGGDFSNRPPSARPPGGAWPPAEKRLKGPAFCHGLASVPPPQICGRFIRWPAVGAKAAWMAQRPLFEIHRDTPRVQWRFVHARNFAVQALALGFGPAVICAAYAEGCRQSHENSCDVDRGVNGERPPLREPSEAVARAWDELRRDGRTVEERWAAFFAAPRLPVAPSAAPRAAERAKPTRAPAPSVAEARAGVLAPGVGFKSFEAALSSRGYTVRQWLKLDRKLQIEIAREIARGH